MAITGFISSESVGATCKNTPNTRRHWISINALDSFQAIIIVALTLIIWSKSESNRSEKGKQKVTELSVLSYD